MTGIGSKSLVSPTLTTCYRPVIDYRKLISGVPECCDAPAVSLNALDAWLLHHIAAFYPTRPTVIDLAAEATLGASTAFWGAQPEIRKVIAPRAGKSDRVSPAWRTAFPHVARELGLRRSKWVLPDSSLDLPGGWEEIKAGLDRFSPLFFLLAVNDDERDQVAARLTTLFTRCPGAVVFVLPLGLIGSSQTLESIVAFAHTGSAYRVTALRESSPFCAGSDVAVVYQGDSAVLPAVFERLHQLLDGNFQFLSLLEAATAAALREQELSQDVIALEHNLRDYQSRQEHLDHELRDYQSRYEHLDHELRTCQGRYEDQLRQKNHYITDIEARMNYLEGTYIPWKNEYIIGLEMHLKNLGSSKALRVGQALQRISSMIGKR